MKTIGSNTLLSNTDNGKFYFDSEAFSNSKVQTMLDVFIDDKLTCEWHIKEL